MRYKVICRFRDLKDKNYIYDVGDAYPRSGRVKKERVDELLSSENKLKKPLIVKVGE